MHDSRDAGRIVGRIRLKFPRAQRLLEGLLPVHQLVDRVRLISVCDNGFIAKHPHRRIDNQAGILQFGGIKRLRAYPLAIRHKHPVPAVAAASHNKICRHRIRAVRRLPDHNSPPRVGVPGELLRKIFLFHLFFPLHVISLRRMPHFRHSPA